MTATAITPDIDQFAKEVRLALKDLGSSEVSELTEGLEADLAAQFEEQGSDFVFPDSASYAAELREAAGLPAHTRGIFALVDRFVRVAADAIAHNPVTSATARFLISLAPIWWIARGYVAYFVFENVVLRTSYGFVPRSFVDWLALVTGVVVSVQLGRRTWKLNRFWVRTVSVLNLFAVIVAPAAFGQAVSVASEALNLYEQGAQVPIVQEGLMLNSQQVDNIFVYDEKGNPLEDVQLFTQSGDPLSVKFNGIDFPQVVFEDAYLDMQYVENQRASRGNGWNVFPLKMVHNSQVTKIDNGEDLTNVLVDTPLPYPSVPALNKSTTR